MGQTDLPAKVARDLLPPGSILGLSVGNKTEAEEAVKQGLVDYVGIGAVWNTTSKDVSGKIMLGPGGVGEILDILAQSEKMIKSVAIGKSACSPCDL